VLGVPTGRCCLCGWNITPSMKNKYGVRCVQEGAQYDMKGNFLYAGANGKPYTLQPPSKD
jgi:hypothetical protein